VAQCDRCLGARCGFQFACRPENPALWHLFYVEIMGKYSTLSSPCYRDRYRSSSAAAGRPIQTGQLFMNHHPVLLVLCRLNESQQRWQERGLVHSHCGALYSKVTEA